MPWPATIGGAPYKIRWDSLTERGSDRDVDVSLTFLVDWERRYDFVNGAIGNLNGGIVGLVPAIPPLAFPDSPNLVCRGWDIKGKGFKRGADLSVSKVNHHKIAEITLNFKPPTWSGDTNMQANPGGEPDQTLRNALRYCEMTMRCGSQILEIDAKNIEYVDHDAPFEGSFGKPVVSGELSLTFPKVNFLAWSRCYPYLGKINKNPIFGIRAGHLLFADVQSNPASDGDGFTLRSLTMSFLTQDHHWNSIYDASGTPRMIRFKLPVDVTTLPDDAWGAAIDLVEAGAITWPPGTYTRPFLEVPFERMFV